MRTKQPPDALGNLELFTKVIHFQPALGIRSLFEN